MYNIISTIHYHDVVFENWLLSMSKNDDFIGIIHYCCYNFQIQIKPLCLVTQ